MGIDWCVVRKADVSVHLVGGVSLHLFPLDLAGPDGAEQKLPIVHDKTIAIPKSIQYNINVLGQSAA